MNLVTPYALILGLPDSGGIELLRKIEAIGRVSHRSEDAQTADSYDRFIRAVVIGHGDWSITEHASVTVEALVDRGITHEWVRHRLFAYTQESTRFVNYTKGGHPPAFIRPPEFLLDNLGGQSIDVWATAMRAAEDAYRLSVENGVSPQMARSLLPNALASKLVVTGNLRAWRHFFVMRTTKEAHPQMREVSIPLLAEFKARIPILYDDIQPEARQAESMRLPR